MMIVAITDIALTLFTWIAVVGAVILTPFLSLMLVIGWSNLIARHTLILNDLQYPYRQIALACYLYSPSIAAACAVSLLTFERLRFWVPVSSLCILNFGPFAWIIGTAGLLVIGLQSNRYPHPTLIRSLFLIAGICYMLSILVSLISVSSGSGGSILRQDADWESIMFLNSFMAVAFGSAAISPTKIRSWRAILTIIVLVFASTFALRMLSARYPLPVD